MSDNLWLKRTCLFFQIKYKKQTDLDLLAYCINQTKENKEFFLRKAIGWSLREYSKVDPDWVFQYINSQELSPLSKREALKRIKRQATS